MESFERKAKRKMDDFEYDADREADPRKQVSRKRVKATATQKGLNNATRPTSTSTEAGHASMYIPDQSNDQATPPLHTSNLPAVVVGPTSDITEEGPHPPIGLSYTQRRATSSTHFDNKDLPESSKGKRKVIEQNEDDSMAKCHHIAHEIAKLKGLLKSLDLEEAPGTSTHLEYFCHLDSETSFKFNDHTTQSFRSWSAESTQPPGVETESSNELDQASVSGDDQTSSIETDYETSGYDEENIDSLTYLRLEDFPAEILELIMWYAQNPDLPLTSKIIFPKLGHQRKMRMDMLLVALSDCRPVEGSYLEDEIRSQARVAPYSDLLFEHALAKSTRLTRTTTQSMFVSGNKQLTGALWCTPEILRQAAARAMRVWLKNSGWHEDMFEGKHREMFCDLVENADHQVPMDFDTKDGSHHFDVDSLYSIRIACELDGDGTTCSQLPGCPGSEFCEKKVFRIPSIPIQVLQAKNNSAKTEMLRFYEGYSDHHYFIFYCERRSFCVDKLILEFDCNIRDAIFVALKDKASDIVYLLLSYGRTCTEQRSQEASQDWRPTLHTLLSMLATTQTFAPIARVVSNTTVFDHAETVNDTAPSMEVAGGIEVMEHHDKALVLMLAEEYALDHIDHGDEDTKEALRLLEWWVHDNLNDRFKDTLSGNKSAHQLAEQARQTAEDDVSRFRRTNAFTTRQLGWSRREGIRAQIFREHGRNYGWWLYG